MSVWRPSVNQEFSVPKEMFRLGECPTWIDQVWAAGTEIQDQSWDAPREGISNAQRMEVQAVTWEIHAENDRDLDQMIWLGSLEWDFKTVRVPIGPLSMFAGGEADRRFLDTKTGDMEKLAAVAGGHGPTEEAWRAFAQTLSLGRSLFFRGAQRYEKHPVSIPANSHAHIQLKMRQNYTTLSEIRFRVVFHNIFRTVVEIG